MNKDELLGLLNYWENFALLVKDSSHFQENLDMLMEIALSGNDPRYWRAAWMADKINEKQFGILQPFVPAIIERLKSEIDQGRKRHFLKLISLYKIPDESDSFLVDYCLSALTSDKEPPAVRVHAMQVLFNISEKLPGLKSELCDIIENEMEFHPTPGILTRGKKLVTKLRKQIHQNV